MSIQDELNQIKSAVYGSDVRDAIHDSIKKTYDDASVNGNANMEVEMARGTEPTLNDRLGKMDDKDESLTTQLAQTEENMNTRKINVLYPPKPFTSVKGDGATDDYEAIQTLIDYGYDNDYSLYFPDGDYLISKPLVVYGSPSGTRRGSHLEGQSREGTTIRKISDEVLDIGEPFNVNAVIIVASRNMDTSEHSRSIQLKNFTFISGSSVTIDYGLYLNSANTVSSRFEDLYSRNVKNGFFFEGNNYLNKYDFLRVQNCEKGIYHNSGILTSNIYSSCYVNACSDTAYRIYGNYITIINPAADSCKAIVYDLSGLQGTVISPGSESVNAEVCFKFSGASPDRTSCVVSGANTWMMEHVDSTHIQMGSAGNVTFVGGWINRNLHNKVSEGNLIEASRVGGVENTLQIYGTRINEYVGVDRLPSHYHIHFAERSVMTSERSSGAFVRFTYGNGQIIPPSTATTVTNWLGTEYNTDSFLVDGTYFVIPRGVSKIRLTCGIDWTNPPENRSRVRIVQDGVAAQLTSLPSSDIYSKSKNVNLTSGVIEVEEGDRFCVEVYHEHTSDVELRGRNTNYFSLEVVE